MLTILEGASDDTSKAKSPMSHNIRQLASLRQLIWSRSLDLGCPAQRGREHVFLMSIKQKVPTKG